MRMSGHAVANERRDGALTHCHHTANSSRHAPRSGSPSISPRVHMGQPLWGKWGFVIMWYHCLSCLHNTH